MELAEDNLNFKVMYCRNCGEVIADNAYVCLNCGVKAGVGSKHCPVCGAQPDPQAVVCVKCGTSLSRSSAGSEVENEFVKSIKTCFLQKYATFEGRASRSEYWYFYLLVFVLGFIPFLNFVVGLATFIPMLAAGVRRLHDVGKSGWMLLITLIPIIGTIWLIVLLASPSQEGTNEYGPCE